MDWLGSDSPLAKHLDDHCRRTLEAYGVQPRRVEEDARIEEGVTKGGYARRQLFELVQNAADALSEGATPGRVAVVLTTGALYCANEGAPIDADGIVALLMSHLSHKHGSQIGHFGLGFKSVLAVSERPVFYSRAVSFAFDPDLAANQIRRVVGEFPLPAVPVLRLAYTRDPKEDAATDPVLSELMSWAMTVVKLPRDPGSSGWLSDELRAFPAEFLLFSREVQTLELDDRTKGHRRLLELRSAPNGVLLLGEPGDGMRPWQSFSSRVLLANLPAAALQDIDHATRQRAELPVHWAVPLDGGRDRRGRFWAFFPTETETTLRGVVNAPWKTNADRQNLLEGPFNRCLIEAAADLVSAALPRLEFDEDPGRIVDLLPARRDDAANWADRNLAECLETRLPSIPFVPTVAAGGKAQPSELRLRPAEVLGRRRPERWLRCVRQADVRPWPHVSLERADRRSRLARFGAKETPLHEWLASIAAPATAEDSVLALRVARLLWTGGGSSGDASIRRAAIVLDAEGHLNSLAGRTLYLPGDEPPVGDIHVVHPDVARDRRVRRFLESELPHDLVPVLSAATVLRRLLQSSSVRQRDPEYWDKVWELASKVNQEDASPILRTAKPGIYVRCMSGRFAPLSTVLMPGPPCQHG